MTNISVPLFSVRDALDADAVGTLARLKGIGFEQVELFGFVDHADRYAEALATTGLSAPSGHNGLFDLEDAVPVFEAAVRLGVTTVIEPGVREGWATADGVAAIAARLSELAPLAADYGLVLGYHNHWWEFADINGRSALEVFADQVDPRVVLQVDTYWSAVAGLDTPALLRRLGDRVQLIHVKDGPVEEDPSTQLPAGDGAVDVSAILAAAPRAARVIEFDEYAGDIFEGIAASYRYLKQRQA
jgi:sugar phosphate isomerase/epimerase